MNANQSLTRRQAVASAALAPTLTAAATRCIDAFFAIVHWDEAHRRLEGARKA